MSDSVLAPFQGDSQPHTSSICIFCERILLFNGRSSIVPHQPDIIALACSAKSCTLCKFINKHLLAAAEREVGKPWLKKLRNSELGESSSLAVSIHLVSHIPCFRVSCGAGPRVFHTPDICIGSLWTLGTLRLHSCSQVICIVQGANGIKQVNLRHDQFGTVPTASQLSLDFLQ